MAERNENAIPDDHVLLRRLQFGDFDAPTHLYYRYAERLRKFARMECSPQLARQIGVEDLIQSSFGSFFRKAKEGHVVVPEGQDLWCLLLVITLNKIRAKALHLRRAKRDVRRTTSMGITAWLESRQAGDNAARGFLRMVIEEVMAKFPPKEREMFCLRIDGHDVEQISQKTGWPKRTVERRLREFRDTLAGALEEEKSPE